MPDLPRMLYKADGEHEIHGGFFDYIIVDTAEELDSATALGWSVSPAEATEHKEQAKMIAAVPVPPMVPMDAQPTRDELERKATELGIQFDGRTTDAKLAGKIAALVKE